MKLLFTIKRGSFCFKAIPLFMILIMISAYSYAVDYYVAKTGNDGNNGLSISSPFLTLQKAADVASSGDVINVRTGTYREMVDMKASGITYQPYNGELVTINGTDLMLTWSLTSGSTYQTTMSWDVDNNWGTNQIFSDGKMIELARWPNQTSSDVIMPTNAFADAVTSSGNSFTITDADFNEPSGRWVGAKIWVNLSRKGYDGQGWTGTVTSTSGNTITVDFREPARMGDKPWGLGSDTEYFLFNPTAAGVNASGGVDALLSNGEWWKNGNTLYVKTPNGSNPSSNGSGSNVIEAKRRHFAFWASTTRSNYTIKDFNLFACAVTTDKNATTNRIIVEAAHDIMIDGLKVLYPSHQTDMTGNWQDQHYSWTGMVISGRNNTIKNCTIRYAATSAISIQGFNIKVLNNQIQDANYMCSNSGAMNTSFVCQDAEIANNKFWNTTMMAINFKYSKNSNPNVPDVYRIHHNEIFDFMRRSGDSGAIDMVDEDLQWIRIDHNLIYNTSLVPQNANNQTAAIYFDYGAVNSGAVLRATADHNVIYNVRQAILINPAKYINIFNNVIISGGPGPIKAIEVNTDYSDDTNIKIYNNILDGPVTRNLLNGGAAPFLDIKNNITNATGSVLNELFVDPANRNYNLKPTAFAAIDKGISVGVYDDNVVGLPDLGAKEWGQISNKYEAEAAILAGGASTANNHSGYSGSGFVQGYGSQGASTTFTVNADFTTSYNVSLKYANGTGSDKTISIYVNGTKIRQTILPSNSNWSTWTSKIESLSLNAGANTINYQYDSGDGGNVNLDFILLELTPDNQAPTAPTALQASLITGKSFKLNWTASTDNIAVTSYEIFLNGASVGSTTNNSTTFEVSGVNPSTTYAVTIKAKDAIGNASAASSTLSVQTGALRYEAEESNLNGGAYIGNNHPNFSGSGFAQGFGTLGASVTFNVNINSAGNFNLNLIYANGGSNIQTLSLFVNGTKIRQINLASSGSWSSWASTTQSVNLNSGSNTIMLKYDNGDLGNVNLDYITVNSFADTQAPTAPSNLQATAVSSSTLTLNWSASTDNIGVTSYEILRNNVSIGSTSTATSYNVSGLSPNTTYSLTVKAKDAAGNISQGGGPLSVQTTDLRYEAESATLAGGAGTANNHTGFSGSGFVQGYGTQGASTTFTVNVSSTSIYNVILIYGNGNSLTRTLSIYVNGTKIKQTSLAGSGSWSTWATKIESLNLNAGNNTIMYRYDSGDGGNVNIDYIKVSFPTKYEAENGTLNGGAFVDTNHPNYSGTGFVAGYGTQGASTSFNVNVSSSTSYNVALTYANGNGTSKTLSLYVNGTKIRQISLPTSGGWSTFATATESVTLNSGSNTIMYRYDSGDGGSVNLDYILLSSTNGTLAYNPITLDNLSLPSNDETFKANIYPNPAADGWLNVEFGEKDNGKLITMYVYDLSGRKLIDKIFVVTNSSERINIESLVNGVYMVNLRGDGISFSKKLIVR